MAEEDEPLLRESGEGVTVTAGPEPGLQQSVSSQGKASERERVSPPGPGQCHASLATETRKYVKRRDKNS